MKQKKPDIFLGITMAMLVLAAVLCVAILLAQKAGQKPASNNTLATSQASKETKEDSNTSTEPVDPNTNPGGDGQQSHTQLTGDPIKASDLKKDLDNEIKDFLSEWQIVVFDPANNQKVASYHGVGSKPITSANDLMKSVSLVRLFVMADTYQQIKDGAIKEEDVSDDLTAMIAKGDKAAGDRLVEVLGGGDAAKGREHVKAYAKQLGCTIGFNRPFQGNDAAYNYVSAESAASTLNKIVRGECVSPEYDQKMLDLLFAVEKDDIDLGISGEGVTKGFLCDLVEGFSIGAVGVVDNGQRIYVVCLISNEIKSMDSGKKMTAEILGIIQPYFEK